MNISLVEAWIKRLGFFVCSKTGEKTTRTRGVSCLLSVRLTPKNHHSLLKQNKKLKKESEVIDAGTSR